MANEHQASGGINIFGCVQASLAYNPVHKYSVGDIVYSKPKALDGVLEKYCIREVKLFADQYDPHGSRVCVHCQFFPLYMDTTNAYHNEEDLVTYSEAAAFVEAALIRKAQLLEEVARKC